MFAQDQLTEGDESFSFNLYSDPDRKQRIFDPIEFTVYDTSKGVDSEGSYVASIVDGITSVEEGGVFRAGLKSDQIKKYDKFMYKTTIYDPFNRFDPVEVAYG